MAGLGGAPARRILTVGLLSLMLCATLAGAARAADTIYWGDDDTADAILFAGLDGTGVQPFHTGDTPAGHPDGLAIDSAAGRIYWASSAAGKILWAALDGSASGQLDTRGAPVIHPNGLALDLVARRVYWANFGTGPSNDSIASASLDGGGGQPIDTTGATVDRPTSIVIDPVTRRVYWSNFATNAIVSASLDGGGGQALNTDAAVSNAVGLAIDPSSRRIYWINQGSEPIWSALLDGNDGKQLDVVGATVLAPQGLAIDPVAGRIYWANTAEATISSAALAGGGRDLVVGNASSTATFPILQVAPRAVAAPAIAGAARLGATLTCTPATWAPDITEAFFWQAPQTTALQWTREGQAIPGADQSTVTVTAGGDYDCRSSARNHAGETVATSPPIHVEVPPEPGSPRAFGVRTRVTVRLATAPVRARGSVAVRIENGNAFAITGRLSARTVKPVAGRRRVRLAARSFSARASGSRLVKLTMPRALRTLLAHRHRLGLRVSATVTDPAGHRRTVVRTVTLRVR
jgi:hypothetical protein